MHCKFTLTQKAIENTVCTFSMAMSEQMVKSESVYRRAFTCLMTSDSVLAYMEETEQ